MAIISTNERAGAVLGVPGHFFASHTWDAVRPLFSTQTWKSEARKVSGYGAGGEMVVELRFDDQCRNGHNTFSITADVYTTQSRRMRDIAAGGCMHDEIAKIFPELAPLILWHLVSTDGPMHYVANTLYHASDRDHNGLQKGEVRQIRNGRTGELCWYRPGIGSKYADGATCPTDDAMCKWEPLTRTGEGKTRELDHARSSACWPEATDAELCADRETLRAALEARLPELMQRFRAAILATGFQWEPGA